MRAPSTGLTNSILWREATSQPLCFGDFPSTQVVRELAAASDAAEVRWFARDERSALGLAEHTLDLIRKGLQGLRSARK
jgi:hypothetical protein